MLLKFHLSMDFRRPFNNFEALISCLVCGLLATVNVVKKQHRSFENVGVPLVNLELTSHI